jgi:hypothetical protein
VPDGRSILAWKQHLKHSHLTGQSFPVQHSYLHWLILKFGFRQRNIKEVSGQVIRLIVGRWKSFIDHEPLGIQVEPMFLLAFDACYQGYSEVV